MPGREPPVSFLISAEHASNHAPEEWLPLFAAAPELLDGHRAWDPGSRELARRFASTFGAPLLEGRITRLLIDLNRSANHPRRFSQFSRNLLADRKQELIDSYWQPHWDRYREHLASLPGQIVHIACHSFTPIMNGKTRHTDIGLLYDPSRPAETQYCRNLCKALRAALPELVVHMNMPYQGVSNGMGQQHRRLHDDRRLITFELEVNQRLFDQRPDIGKSIVEAVKRDT